MLINQVVLYLSLTIIAILTVILLVLIIKIRNKNKFLFEASRLIQSGISYIGEKINSFYSHNKREFKRILAVSDIKEMISKIKKSVEKELQFINLIIDNIKQGILIINKNKEIIIINESLLNLFYLRREEILYKKTVFVFKNEKFENLIDNAFKQLLPQREDIVFHGDDEKYLSVEILPLNSGEGNSKKKDVNLLIILENITQEMEFSKLRSQFVANISHEMKTPLTSIKGYIDTILGDNSINRNKMRDYLSRSLKEVEKLNYLIKDVLNLSNIEYKRNILFEKNHNLVEIIKETIKTLGYLAKKNNIKINFEYSSDKISYQTDEELFTQMVRNIIENSIFYGGNGIKININLKEDKSKIQLTFKDNGIGIEKDELPYIFQRFYRGKSSQPSKQIGSGLGLSIVKHTVELHNGRISVHSIPYEETVFKITLPKKAGMSDFNNW